MIHGIKKRTDRLHQYCCVRYPAYGAWHEHPYHSHTHWFVFLVFFIGWTMGLFFQLHLFPLRFVGAASYSWNQASWAGNTTTDNANHTGNQAAVSPYPWTKYSAKDANLTAGATLTLSSISATVTQTSDTDFNAGTNSSTTVSGSGASANVQLSTGAASWATSSIDTTGDVGYGSNSSLDAIDANTIFISYVDNTNDDLKFAKSTNGGSSWTTSAIDTTDLSYYYSRPSLDATDANTIFASYKDDLNNDLEFAKSTNGGSSWTLSTIDSTGDVGAFSSLYAVNANTIFISYANNTNFYSTLKFAKSTDAGSNWTLSTVDSPSSVAVGSYSSLYALDANTIFISYWDGTNRDLKFAKSTDGGSTWTKSAIDTTGNVGSDTSLYAIDANTIYISYFDDTNNDLKFIKSTNGGSSWTASAVDTAANLSATSLSAIDANTISIGYYEQDSSDLKYAKSTDAGSNWALSTVDSHATDQIGNDPSLYAFDANTVFMRYGTFTSKDLKFAKYSVPYTSPGTFTSSVIDTGQASTFTTLDFTATTPASTTLTVDVRAGNVATPDGTWTAWQTSITNGGSISALNGNRYAQYRANLSTTDTSATPSLASISINSSSYSASQVLTSSQFNTEASTAQIAQIAWSETPPDVPTGTNVRFQIRTAPDASGVPGTWSDWLGPTSASDYYETTPAGETVNSINRSGSDDQWMQYRTYLTSTGVNTPTLSGVTISYNTFPATPSLSSSTHSSQTTFYTSAEPLITITAGTPTPNHYHYLVNQTASPTIDAVAAGTNTGGSFAVPPSPGDNTITGDGTWYVHVVAHDSAHTSSANFASYTVKRDATAPTSATLSFGSVTASSVTVSASASDATAGLHTTPYYFDRNSGAANSNWITGNWTDSGLSTNTQYTYRVKSRDAAATPNESSFTATQSKYTAAQVPGTPSVTSPTASTLKVTIDRNGNPTGGTPSGDTEYAIAASTDNFGSVTQFVQANGTLGGSAAWQTYTQWGTTSGVTTTGLNADTTYSFKVKARNGDQLETSYSSITSGYTAAGSPTNFQTSSSTASTATLTVDRFAGDTTGQAGYYFSRTGVNSGWITTNTWTDTNLSPNTTYAYSIKTRDSSAVESGTSTLEMTTPAATPLAPTVNSAEASDTSVRLTIASGTNPAATEYALQETTTNQYVQTNGSLGASAAWRTVSQWGTVTVTGLSANTAYNFQAKARNSTGSETIFGTITYTQTLALPGVVVFDEGASTKNTVTFSLASSANPSTIEYALQETTTNQYVQTNGSLGASAAWRTVSQWGAVTVTGLTASSTYTFRVKARNTLTTETAFGASASVTTLAAGVPRAPTLPVNGRTAATLVLIIDATDLEASREYAVLETTQNKYLQGDGAFSTTPIWRTYTQWGSTTGVTITNLSAHRTYTFKVKSRDPNTGNVESSFGPLASAGTTGGSVDTVPPALPTTIEASVTSNNESRLTWSDSSDAEFVRVLIFRSETSALPGGAPIAAMDNTAHAFIDTTVQTGKTYTYYLRFEDAAGNGTLSNLLRVNLGSTATRIEQVSPVSSTTPSSVTINTETVLQEITPPTSPATESDLNVKELIRIQYPAPIATGAGTEGCTGGQLICSLNRLFSVERIPGIDLLVDRLVPTTGGRQETFRTRQQVLSGSPTGNVNILGRFGLLYDFLPLGTTAGATLAQPVTITLRYSPRDAALILRTEHSLALAYLNPVNTTWEIVPNASHDRTVGSFSAAVTRAGTYGIVITKSP